LGARSRYGLSMGSRVPPWGRHFRVAVRAACPCHSAYGRTVDNRFATRCTDSGGNSRAVRTNFEGRFCVTPGWYARSDVRLQLVGPEVDGAQVTRRVTLALRR
jgi:hypothetical protein